VLLAWTAWGPIAGTQKRDIRVEVEVMGPLAFAVRPGLSAGTDTEDLF